MLEEDRTGYIKRFGVRHSRQAQVNGENICRGRTECLHLLLHVEHVESRRLYECVFLFGVSFPSTDEM